MAKKSTMMDTLSVGDKVTGQIQTLRRKHGDVMTREALKAAYNQEGWAKWADAKIVKNRAFQYTDHDPFLYILSIIDLTNLQATENASGNAAVRNHKHHAVMTYLAGSRPRDVVKKYLEVPPTPTRAPRRLPKFLPRKVDWTQVEISRVATGLAGEEWLYDLLKRELSELGFPELNHSTRISGH